jgi:hypothetical protein
MGIGLRTVCPRTDAPPSVERRYRLKQLHIQEGAEFFAGTLEKPKTDNLGYSENQSM